MYVAKSLQEALLNGTNLFHTGRTCSNGHTDVVEYINSRSPLKTKCYECRKIADAAKKARKKSDPAVKAEWNERVKKINRERYKVDAEFRRRASEGRFAMLAGRPVADTAGKTAKYIAEARRVHGDKYDYSKVEYVNCLTPLTIICPVHGEFKQTMGSHIRQGRDCPECMKSFSTSKSEDAVARFIESLGVPVQRNVRGVIGSKELDIYCPDRGIAVEYCGLRWHSTLFGVPPGAPYEDVLRADRDKRSRHRDKYLACQAAGIRLITIFEDEWVYSPEVVKKTLRHIFGGGGKVAGARQLEVVIGKPDGAFFRDNHLQGEPSPGSVVVYGKFGGRVVCAMAFSRAYSERGSNDGSWELARFCSVGSVPGAASRLFKGFLAAHSPGRIISYSDNRWFDGSMYRALGFAEVEEAKPAYWVTRWQKRWHKSRFKRSSIPVRIAEVGSEETFDPETDPRTELAMTHLLGFGRIYDCGKRKWEYCGHGSGGV